MPPGRRACPPAAVLADATRVEPPWATQSEGSWPGHDALAARHRATFTKLRNHVMENVHYMLAFTQAGGDSSRVQTHLSMLLPLLLKEAVDAERAAPGADSTGLARPETEDSDFMVLGRH